MAMSDAMCMAAGSAMGSRLTVDGVGDDEAERGGDGGATDEQNEQCVAERRAEQAGTSAQDGAGGGDAERGEPDAEAAVAPDRVEAFVR
jgi:hypothetical protein